MLRQQLTLFLGMFSTLLAIINPLEALPVFLKLLQGQDLASRRRVARQSSFYAMLLAFFFLLFGTLIMRLFGVPLSMVRIVGGIILMRIGFTLFAPESPSSSTSGATSPAGQTGQDVAFVPLAMPIMFGPGAIATVVGMTSLIKHSEFEFVSFASISGAIVATMFVTYMFLAYADKILSHVSPMGIDAATRIVGFFVATMGMGLIFHGVVEAIQMYAPRVGH
jgi:multiple antibiotic resistance protein